MEPVVITHSTYIEIAIEKGDEYDVSDPPDISKPKPRIDYRQFRKILPKIRKKDLIVRHIYIIDASILNAEKQTNVDH